MKAKLHVTRGAMECLNMEKKELTKRFLALKDAYLELVEKYGPLMVEKETLENDIEALNSSVEDLTTEIAHQLFLGFDFNFEKLDNIIAAKTMRQTHAATMGDGEVMMEETDQPACILNALSTVEHTVRSGEDNVKGAPHIYSLLATRMSSLKSILELKLEVATN